MSNCYVKNLPKALLLCFFALVLSVALIGCGGTFRSFPGEGDVSGSWNIVLTKSDLTSLPSKAVTLDQTDKNIAGTSSDGTTITGIVSGNNNVSLTLINTDGSVTTLTGTVSGDWKAMSGTYTSTGSEGSGTWDAAKNAPVPPETLAVTPASATLSCSTGQSASFTVTGGIPSKYTVSPTANGTLVSISTSSLKTDGKFVVTALTTCGGTSGTVVSLSVSDTHQTLIVPVTISNP